MGLAASQANLSSSLPPIRFDNVTKHYLSSGAAVAALNQVTFEAQGGEFVAVMGRSGCGKSTLLNLAGAMDLPTSGRVCVAGQETAALDDAGLTRLRRTVVGFVFQSFQLLQNMSAVENVELPLLLAGAGGAREKARAELARVELTGMEDRLPHQLSGGEMQRVAIARALVHAPKILLADEPTGNLDTTTGDVVLRLLRDIASRGVLILMATHSAESAQSCDRVIQMRDGRITG